MVDKSAVVIMVVLFVVLIFSLLGVSGYLNIGGIGGSTGECTGKCGFNPGICGFFVALGFPECWLQTSTFIWYAFLPITAIWMIIFGFLDKIRIFKASINAALAFLIAFSTIPLGLFVLIVSFVFGIMGMYSVFLFVGLFFIGTIMYSRGLIFGWRGQFGSYAQARLAQEKLKGELDNRINVLQNELNAATATPPTGRFATMGAAERQGFIDRTGKEMLEAKKQKAAAEAAIEHYKRSSKASKAVFKRIQET